MVQLVSLNVEFNDGTYFKSVQLVYTDKCQNHDVLSSLKTGAAITVTGKLVLTPENKQPFEIAVESCVLEGDVADDYPLQKKRHSFEFLREIAHIRPRANTFQAVYRVRFFPLRFMNSFKTMALFMCTHH